MGHRVDINERAQRTAELLRQRRQTGLAPRRRRIPRQIPPDAIAREYARALMGVLDQVERALQPLIARSPGWLETARRERMDAGEGAAARGAIAAARLELTSAVTPTELERIARRFGSRTTDYQRAQLVRQIRAALGVHIFMSDRRIAGLLDGFVAENVALITNITERTIGDVEVTVTRAIQSGATNRTLAKDIKGIVEGGRKRARLIARDQIGKLYGQASETRQRDMGIEEYIWRTVNDERVRPEHADREGERFTWKDPPADGHPGQAIQCRCFPEPVFDAILGAASDD
jgi:SPP1 gp7 family putative phage head morphogenesis protein